MHVPKFLALFFCIAPFLKLYAQEENSRGTRIGITGGVMGYQGDLQPNSFSLRQVSPFVGAYVRQPLLQRLSLKAGFNKGTLHAEDKNNREYLKLRNLSFYTRITEGFLALDYELLPLARYRFTPFAYGGLVYFHYNPYAFDASGEKAYLQPLGTEGQGLARYPDRKPYKLSQTAVAFGGGFRFGISSAVQLSLELGQRKTFTDYLDDVSKSYADEDALFAVRGAKAVALAFRGDELPGGGAYPKEGEQRGTPSEMDWYYTTALSLEIRLGALRKQSNGRKALRHRDVFNMRCPRMRP